MTIHDLTTEPTEFDSHDVITQHLTADAANAVLFTVVDYEFGPTTYALVRVTDDTRTESDTLVSAGQLAVYYADSATTAYFAVADFADCIPSAAYTLI